MPKPTENANVQQPASELPVSVRRRHLLKAAASAAPLIATLPSGAARANSSSYQCVLSAADAPINEDEVSASPTALLRQQLVKLAGTNGKESRTYYGHPCPDTVVEDLTKNWWRDASYASVEWWRETSTGFELLPCKACGDTQSKPPQAPDTWTVITTKAYGLRLFRTDGQATGVVSDDMDFIPSVAYEDGTNFPLNGSCLCSVDPQSSAYCDWG